METKYVVLWVVVAVIALGGLFYVFSNRNSDVSTIVKIDTAGTDYIQDLDNFKDALNKNYTGGYTIEDGEKMQADADCPTANDQFNTMYFQESGDFVIFYYTLKTNNSVIYPNLVFRRVQGGKLELDGLANTYLHCINTSLKYQWKYAEMVVDFNEVPCYKSVKYATTRSCGNFARLSVGCKLYWNGYIHNSSTNPSKKEEQNARQLLLTAMNEVIAKYFMSFDGLRLQAETADGVDVYKYINTYFAYLYNSSDKVVNTTTTVNVNEFLTYDIPESEQSSYPIPASKKADYPSDWNYYKMYKCDKYTKVVAVPYKCNQKGIKVFYDDSKAKIDKDETLLKEDDGSTECEVITPQAVTYSEVTVKLRATNNVDFTGFDASESPVTITFTADNVIPKTLVFNTKSAILTGQNISLVMGKTYNYSIDSGALSFDSFTGTMPLLAKKGTLTLDYTYLNGAVVCEFGLNVVGDIDLTAVDLSTNPVLIQLKDDNSTTYEIRISDNAYLSNNKMFTMVLPVGTYTYTIASDVLLFPTSDASVSILIVSTSSRQFVFNCLQKQTSFTIYADAPRDEEEFVTGSSIVTVIFGASAVYVAGEQVEAENYLNNAKIELLEYCEGNLRTYTLSGWGAISPTVNSLVLSQGFYVATAFGGGAYGDFDSDSELSECQYQVKVTYGDRIAVSNVITWTPNSNGIYLVCGIPDIFKNISNGVIISGGVTTTDGTDTSGATLTEGGRIEANTGDD